jgi:DNA-damage-inducible protein D
MKSIVSVNVTLDQIKKMAPNGSEYWMARDLQAPLGYERWEDFESVIKKAQMSCESMGIEPNNHFHLTGKMVSIGSGAKREVIDFYISRYAAYLIAMNGNPKLPQIAAAQNYFAVQTRRQELNEASDLDSSKRLELRKRVKDANKHLNDAAKKAGVQNYGLFHEAGYRGLYGIGLKEIKAKKGINAKEQLLDRAGRAELAANEFRITQAEEVLTKDEVKDENRARQVHHKVGKIVRDTIKEIGGTMPEDLPAEQPIKLLERRKKMLPKKDDNKGSS